MHASQSTVHDGFDEDLAAEDSLLEDPNDQEYLAEQYDEEYEGDWRMDGPAPSDVGSRRSRVSQPQRTPRQAQPPQNPRMQNLEARMQALQEQGPDQCAEFRTAQPAARHIQLRRRAAR